MTKQPRYARRPASTEVAVAELEDLSQISDDDIDALAEARAASIAEFEALSAPPEPEFTMADQIDPLAKAEAVIEALLEEIEALSAPKPEPDTISVTDLTLLSMLPRFERIAQAAENSNTLRKAGNEELAASLHRFADTLDSIAATLNCITESVEGADGISRCYVRHDRTTGNILSFADDRDDGED